MAKDKFNKIWVGYVQEDYGEAGYFYLSDSKEGVIEQLVNNFLEQLDLEWEAENNPGDTAELEAREILRLEAAGDYTRCWNLLLGWLANGDTDISIYQANVLITKPGDWWDVWLAPNHVSSHA